MSVHPFLRLSVDERAQQVAPMMKAGMLQKEIAAKLGVSDSQIVRCVRHARNVGLLPHKKKQRGWSILGRLPTGRLGDEVNRLDDDIQKWIYKNIPEGATIASFAVACLVDQYYEERGE